MDFRLEELKRSLNRAVDGMSSEQLKWHPAEKWCAAEVLEHLYLSYTGTIRAFEKVIASGRPLVTKPSLKQRVQTIVAVGFGYLPEGRKAPLGTVPKGLAPEKVKNDVGGKIEAMDAIITQCEGIFGRRTKLLNHPILGPLTATQWRKFHLVHGLHHQKQLLRLREGSRATN